MKHIWPVSKLNKDEVTMQGHTSKTNTAKVESKLNKLNHSSNSNFPRRVIPDTRKLFRNNSTRGSIITVRRTTIIMAIVFFALLANGFTHISRKAFADSGSGGVTFAVDVPTGSLIEVKLFNSDGTNMGNTVSMDVVPSMSAAGFNEKEVVVSVGTNNEWGYNLMMNIDNTSLVSSSNSSKTIPSLAERDTAYTCTKDTADTCDFTLNSWGFQIKEDTNSQSATNGYIAIPNSIKLNENTTITNGDPTHILFGSKINASQAAGAYSTTINFVATANPNPNPAISFDSAFAAAGKQKVIVSSGSYYTMQDMTMAICGSVDNWDVDTNAPTIQLVDTRDNKVYYVSKLKDGNCWMTRNLQLSSGGNLTLTPTNSDVSADFILTAPGELEFSDVNYDVINYRSNGQYNWYTATAGTGLQAMTSGRATDSICPAGWKLPINNADNGAKSYSNLVNSYHITTSNLSVLSSSPLYFSASNYYWSSVAKNETSASGMYYSTIFTTLSPDSSTSKYNGNYIRCVAKNAPGEVTLKYDQNTTDSVFNLPTAQVLTNYDGESTTFTVSSQVPTRDGYTFIGWAASSTGYPGYRAGATAYLSASALYTGKLYAIWDKNIYVSYHDNGGNSGPGSNVYAGAPTVGLKLSTAQPTRSGYYFDGWSLDQNAEWADYRAGATFSVTDIPNGSTLYAVWRSDPYTITYTTGEWSWEGNRYSSNIHDSDGTILGTQTATKSYDTYKILVDVYLDDFSCSAGTTSGTCKFSGWRVEGYSGNWKDSYFEFPLYTNHVDMLDSFSSPPSCIAAGTLITLADGTTKPVEDLTGDELLLAWDFETGSYVARPIVFIEPEPINNYHIIRTVFSDGTYVDNSYEHGYFDLNLGKFIYINENNPEQYIGHSFVRQTHDGWEAIKLVDIRHRTERTTLYGLNTFETINFYVNNMLSIEGNITGMFNYFDVDTTTMAYDPAKKASDLATYGEFAYDDFKDVISELGYEAFNGRYLKVSIGKGLITWDGIKALADRYNPLIDGDDD